MLSTELHFETNNIFEVLPTPCIFYSGRNCYSRSSVELFPCTRFKNISGFQLFVEYTKLEVTHPGYMHLKYCCTIPGGLMDETRTALLSERRRLCLAQYKGQSPHLVMERFISSKQIYTNPRIFLC